MGRRAKSFTLAEKQTVAKAKQYERRQGERYVIFPFPGVRNYYQHLIFSAKELLYIQRYNAYWKAHGRQGTSGKGGHTQRRRLSHYPHIPEALVSAALQPLPTDSALFKDAARSADLLDETGLDKWDTGPPYATGTPSDTPGERAFTQRLIEVMHGRRLRMQKEEEQSWCNVSYEVLIERMGVGITVWGVGRVFVAQYQDGHGNVQWQDFG
jgi:hypothetical protein